MVISCFNSILKAVLFFKYFNNFILNYYVLSDHILDVNLDSLLASYQTSVQILYPRKTHNANKQWLCPQIDTVGQQIGLYLLLRHSKSEHWLKTQLLRLRTNSLLMHLGRQWNIAQLLGSQDPCRRQSSFLLDLTCSHSPGHWSQWVTAAWQISVCPCFFPMTLHFK